MSRAPRPLQGSHVDSPQVAEVVAVSVAVLAVIVVVVKASGVTGGCLLLQRHQRPSSSLSSHNINTKSVLYCSVGLITCFYSPKLFTEGV